MSDYLLLEDGTILLREDDGTLLLERATSSVPPSADGCSLLQESGYSLLLESGSRFIQESCVPAVPTTTTTTTPGSAILGRRGPFEPLSDQGTRLRREDDEILVLM